MSFLIIRYLVVNITTNQIVLILYRYFIQLNSKIHLVYRIKIVIFVQRNFNKMT